MKTPTKEVRKKPYEAQSFVAGEKKGKKEALEDELKFLESVDNNIRNIIEDYPNILSERITEIKRNLEELNGK